MSTIRVLLVDDHPVVLSGIRGMLETDGGIEIAGEASSGGEGLRLAKELHPDVVLLDIELPDIHGSQVAQQLKLLYPEIKILALSAHDDPIYVRSLLEIGAAGYLMKEEAPAVIIEAVRGVANGERRWVSQRITEQIVSWMQPDGINVLKLTTREQDVLRLVVDGKTNQAIAAELKISQKTVEKYLGAIFSKLNVTSRVEAAVYAVREGLVKPK